jgi:xylose isomerase
VSQTIFSEFPTVRFARPESKEDLVYRWYDADPVVLEKTLREHMRFAVTYWHSLATNGSDPFGAPTIRRPWMNRSDAFAAARDKADAAFDLFRLLDLPFFPFHDGDIAPEGDTLRDSLKNIDEMADYPQCKMSDSKTRLYGDREPVQPSAIHVGWPLPILIQMYLHIAKRP